MKPDDVAKIRRATEAPWDEVREQRVLAGVTARRERPGGTRVRASRFVAAGVAFAALAAALAVFWHGRSTPIESPISFVTSAPDHRLSLRDGSEAIFLQDANITVEEQTATRVRLVQTGGTVRYEVKPDRSRAFSVRAGSATVHVRGTIFTVRVLADSLEVSVERGRVAVEEGGRTRDLVAGESLRVATDHASPASPARALDLEPALAVADAAVPVPTPTAAAPPPPASSSPGRPAKQGDETPASLLRAADLARAEDRPAEAAAALETLERRYPHDPSVPAALFTLGRVETARARHASAAQAFERCAAAAPNGPLAEDATSSAALAWASAGQSATAERAASSYLARWPAGIHAAQMRAIREQ